MYRYGDICHGAAAQFLGAGIFPLRFSLWSLPKKRERHSCLWSLPEDRESFASKACSAHSCGKEERLKSLDRTASQTREESRGRREPFCGLPFCLAVLPKFQSSSVAIGDLGVLVTVIQRNLNCQVLLAGNECDSLPAFLTPRSLWRTRRRSNDKRNKEVPQYDHQKTDVRRTHP